MSEKKDVAIVRDLAARYAECAAKPVQEERRRLWTAHFSLQPVPRTPVLATYGMWNVWCREMFGDHALKCVDPFFRRHERTLRMMLFHDTIGDDFILEPWLTQGAVLQGNWLSPWGLEQRREETGVEGGAWRFDPPLRIWADACRMRPTPHSIDEAETARRADRLRQAVGDILPVDVPRGTFYSGFNADISTHLTRLRGLEPLMMDMYDHPRELHQVLAFMRDAILADNQAAEAAGDYSLTTQSNQAMTYAQELERPALNSGPRPRRALWGFCAAQEFTLISPEFHEAFLFRYQIPLLEHFGLVHYGCCEDLTGKISMLRQLKNLRSIAVAPRADIARCAEQIGRDYVLSWRPSPADMVCCGWDADRVRIIIRHGLDVSRGCAVHILLKDVETLQGEPDRLARWVQIVRDVMGCALP
jgi:hypothetical protein